jgi:hypothetical protein
MKGVLCAIAVVPRLGLYMPDRLQLECMTALTEAMLAEWLAFLSTACHQHPRQDPRYAAAESAAGRDVLYAMARTPDGVVRAVGLFSLRRHPFLPGAHAEATCLSGPVCDDVILLVAFLDSVTQLPAFARVGKLSVTPFWTGEAAVQLDKALAVQGWKVSADEPFRHTGWIDLERSPDEILSSFSKSARREVRRAERQQITLRNLGDETEARKFLYSLNRLHRERGLAPIFEPAFLADFRNLDPAFGTGTILGAFHDGDFVAGLLLSRGRFVAHARHFTTEPTRLRMLSNLRIAPLLWFHGMLWARERGCTALDVEGWRNTTDHDDKMYNIHKYKAEFSPAPVQRISERSRYISRLADMTGSLGLQLRASVRRLKRRLG